MTAAARLTATPAPVGVLIVDDSAVARAALTRICASDASCAVLGAVTGARAAIDWLGARRCDVVLLDIAMPDWDGLAALPELLRAARGARVLIVSSMAAKGAATTVRALALGAADTLAKPAGGIAGNAFAQELVERIARIGRATPAADGAPVLRIGPRGPVGCLAIGASTGGIHALGELLRALPPGFRAPILVTQHLPPVFLPFFAEQLALFGGRPASVARDGQQVLPEHILVAPGDAHLGLVRAGEGARVALLTHDVPSRCRPSVDPMLTAVGELYGADGVGVVLTGMGRDGAEGAATLAAAGGAVVAQDRDSATVWGMPGAVARAGLASLIAAPAAIAQHLARRGSAL